MGSWLQSALVVQYTLLTVVWAVQGNWAKALYWAGATILLVGVSLQK